jgi:2-polyprenyl-3-methyl-5-hydroxy-6-metoxy-1,4-benzoquinol methylase
MATAAGFQMARYSGGRHRVESAEPGELCPACHASDAFGLPIPVADRSVLSDGRIVLRPLDKICCSECRLVRHRAQLTRAEVEKIYTSDYSLPMRAGATDETRGKAYAAIVAEAIGGMENRRRFLDVGCGSGTMLRALAGLSRKTRFWGVDPALASPIIELDDRLTMVRGTLATAGAEWEAFDAIASVNTIEHSADPIAFLRDLGDRLRSDGRIVVVCPAACPANIELLFFDHLWTITPAAMACFADRVGLDIVTWRLLSGASFGFQLFVLEKSAAAPGRIAIGSPGDFGSYLGAWRELDGAWSAELTDVSRPVQAFGAAQMAALLRGYAPRAWERVERLVVDDPAEAWQLGSVVGYGPVVHSGGWLTLVAVHPASQEAVAARIRADGGHPVLLPVSIRF